MPVEIKRDSGINASSYRPNTTAVPFIGICGRVKNCDRYFIFNTLDELKDKFGVFSIIHEFEGIVGKLSDEWSRENGVLSASERILWLRYGPSAREFRNEHIINNYSPALIVGFIGRGKYPDLLNRAKRSDVNIIEVLLK